jgi:hypothetical protein
LPIVIIQALWYYIEVEREGTGDGSSRLIDNNRLNQGKVMTMRSKTDFRQVAVNHKSAFDGMTELSFIVSVSAVVIVGFVAGLNNDAFHTKHIAPVTAPIIKTVSRADKTRALGQDLANAFKGMKGVDVVYGDEIIKAQ